MNYTNLFRNIVLFFFVLGVGLMSYPNDAAAFSKKRIDFDRIKPIEINAVVHDINVKQKYLIVGEQKVYLVEFKLGGDEYRSAFVDEKGDTSYITSLSASRWKGKRVFVRGFKLSNGDIVAGIIKRIRSGR
ncbi:MAG: hypothetical protein JRE28_09210 [Deltaproteobacteria bacterium]|nr:hypothetical protein [Deltaproteobacteria bacterium]